MLTYSPDVLRARAEQLIRNADFAVFAAGIAGLFWGALAGIGIALGTAWIHDRTHANLPMLSPLIFAAVGAVLGGLRGRGRALAVRAEAHMILCHVAIEANGRS